MFVFNISADLTHLTQRLDAIDQKLADQAVQIAEVKQGVEYALSNQADQTAMLADILQLLSTQIQSTIDSAAETLRTEVTEPLTQKESQLRAAVNQAMTSTL